MNTSLLLGFLWISFLLRGLFYSSFLPLWEGYDEWAHFAVAQNLAVHGGVLADREDWVSREVQESLRLAPVPWELRDMPRPSIPHDIYWKLSPVEQVERDIALRSIPVEWSREPAVGGMRAYEALQPPLYDWLISLLLRAIAQNSLLDRVLLLRWISTVIASLLIPIGFLAARRFWGTDTLALGTVALLAVMPELLISVCRVGNECLSVLLYSLLIYLVLDFVDGVPSHRRALSVGAVLGLGLLTKAYFLTAIPALLLLFTSLLWRRPMQRGRLLVQGLSAALISLLIAGWWYWRNLVLTGTLSGLTEAVMLRNLTAWDMFKQVPHVSWTRGLYSVLLSHIWFGDWSSLRVQIWIYYFFFGVILLAAVGLVIATWRLWRFPPPSAIHPLQFTVLLAFYGFFGVGQGYNVLLLFLSKGASTSMGWYMYAVVVAEIMLATVGLYALFPSHWRSWILPSVICCFAALDQYTVHFVSIPYYTGLVAHRPNGTLPAFQLSDLNQLGLGTVLHRLSVNKAPFLGESMLLLLWIFFVLSTFSVVAIGFYLRNASSRLTPGCASCS